MTTIDLRQRPRVLVLGLGIVYVVLAVAGFVHTGFDEFSYEKPVRLFGFLGVSTLLGFVHAGMGLGALLSAWRGAIGAFAPPATIAFIALTAFGVVSRSFPGAGDPLNLTWFNVVLYALSAGLCGWAYAISIRVTRPQKD